MELLKSINFCIAVLFTACYLYQFIYIAVPFLKKSRPHKEARLHRYAVLISARNEEAVIGNLIESIHGQTYPQELIDIFVAADNCTDNTAQIAAESGAHVFERFDRERIGKGYALQFLLKQIEIAYPDRKFDGFFVFDADNILDENYIEEMNRTFSDGYSIVTSYRNSKNYGDNWITAGYALWFLREAQYLNRARMLLGTSCAVSGTGFLFSREILERAGGWNFFLLTEDIEFTVHNVLEGEIIGYSEKAVFFDEQPKTFRQSCRQRLRWAKGYLQVFQRYGTRLIFGVLRKHSFSCYDMAMAIMPAMVLSIISMAINGAILISGVIAGQNVSPAVLSMLEAVLNGYLMLFIVGIVPAITEWKNIYTSSAKKIAYLFTFPLFMFTYVPISLCAFFKKVEWKPIEHSEAKTLAEIRK